jgi:tetratricopeptide (TPR) repeat protein
MHEAPDEGSEEPTRIRLAITSSEKNTEKAIVTLELSGAGSGITLGIFEQTPLQDVISKCAGEAAAIVPRSADLEPAVRLDEFANAFIQSVRNTGFDVERIDGADFSINIGFDLKSGRAFARQEALHPFHSGREDFAASILEKLQDVFRDNSGLVNSIRDKLAAEDHLGAAELATSDITKNAILMSDTDGLFDELLKIDRTAVSNELRKELLLVATSLASKHDRYEEAGALAEDLLEMDVELPSDIRLSVKNIAAISAHKNGESEYALSVWREILEAETELDSGERGWVWRNISFALRSNPTEAMVAASNSADAFLQSGDKKEAALSLKQLSRLQESTDPKSAIDQYDKMLQLLTGNGALEDEIRANVYHGKGSRLLELNIIEDAASAAEKAVELRRGLAGAEIELISSLMLVAMCMKNLGDQDAADTHISEARNLEDQLKKKVPHFEYSRRVAALHKTFDVFEAEALVREVEGSGDVELIAAVNTAAIIANPSLAPREKLRRSEALLRRLKQMGARSGAQQAVKLTIAHALTEQGEFARAEKWYRQIVADHPLDASSHQSLVGILWKLEDWGAAAIVLKDQIDKFGPAPNRLYAYGKSLFESGDMSGAVQALSKCLTRLDPNAELRTTVQSLREKAFELGGTVITPVPTVKEDAPVGLSEVAVALQEFAFFVSSAKRMEFWQRPKGAPKHKWASHPESKGQTLLHTFMQAKFGRRVAAFEEIDTGAGRLDLLLQFAGGLSIIVELKMCGSPYTSTYAKSGEGQVRHYMKNRRVHVGFLLVFDGRSRDAGQPLLAEAQDGPDTVTEILIDVRPTVES